MGTIFKHNGQLLQCKDLQKKLKRMKLTEANIEIIQDNIPNDELEKVFVNLTKVVKIEQPVIEENIIYYIFQNSKGYYLWGYNSSDINYYNRDFGFDVSDYKLIDTCKGTIKEEYRKWNPETKTGCKNI